jgi:hypothetical protein
LAFPENQVSKGRPTGFIEASYLAIEDGAFDAKVFGDPLRQLRESPEDVSISGDQFAFAGLDVGERAEKPSTFNSQMNRSESKGSERLESRMGRRFRSSAGMS